MSEPARAESDLSKSVFRRMGISGHLDPTQPLVLEPFPEICWRGVIRPSVLVLMVDIAAGAQAEARAGGDWTFTADLSLRAPILRVPGRLESHSRLLRGGRGSVTCDVVLTEGGEPFAHGQSGFVRMPRRHGDPEKPHQNEAPPLSDGLHIERPLVEETGIRVVDPSQGLVEAEIRDELRNPAGALQGSIVSLIAEVSAEALADHALGAAHVVTDLDIRYLAMGRVGPVHARAWWIGPPESGTLRVELRDQGNDDRVTTAVLARVVRVSC